MVHFGAIEAGYYFMKINKLGHRIIFAVVCTVTVLIGHPISIS